jgi:hypothetical protein
MYGGKRSILAGLPVSYPQYGIVLMQKEKEQSDESGASDLARWSAETVWGSARRTIEAEVSILIFFSRSYTAPRTAH